MARFDHGGGCSCGLQKVCDCSVDKPKREKPEDFLLPKELRNPRAHPETSYPDDNPKTVMGLAKPSLAAIPPTALIHLANAMADGVKKYGRMNWRDKKITASTYYDAAMRHLLAWYDGEDHARDSGAHHLAHAMACCMIALDAMECGMLNDDRPSKGKAADLIEKFTKK